MTNQNQSRSEVEEIAEQSNASSLKLSMEAAKVAIEQKGLDVRAIDVSKCSSIADHFVIVSATSERHAKGIADKVLESLRKGGEKPNSKDGYDRGEWILLDYSNLIVHIFYEPSRQYYEFDELWKEGHEIELGEELSEQARKLRTGVIPTSY